MSIYLGGKINYWLSCFKVHPKVLVRDHHTVMLFAFTCQPIDHTQTRTSNKRIEPFLLSNQLLTY